MSAAEISLDMLPYIFFKVLRKVFHPSSEETRRRARSDLVALAVQRIWHRPRLLRNARGLCRPRLHN